MNNTVRNQKPVPLILINRIRLSGIIEGTVFNSSTAN